MFFFWETKVHKSPWKLSAWASWEVINKTFSQSKESNVIWNYNVALKAVAPINNVVRDKKSLVNILSSNALQKSINTLAANIGSILPDR